MGFTYKAVVFVWIKTYPKSGGVCFALGKWTRLGAEQCLLFTRGAPRRQSAAVPQVIITPRREHSRKPDELFDVIEACSPGPRLEIFARHPRPGWTQWGDQLPEAA